MLNYPVRICLSKFLCRIESSAINILKDLFRVTLLALLSIANNSNSYEECFPYWASDRPP